MMMGLDQTSNDEYFVRRWTKAISMKQLNERILIYRGKWSSQMDRCWESNDGFAVSSRLIQTPIGRVEHVVISRLDGSCEEITWAAKQQIKNELFGKYTTAIEVYPSEKNLVDVCNVYHLWILPKDIRVPFGIHPVRDPDCPAIERGYDYDLEKYSEWVHSDERQSIIERRKLMNK